ncbi:PI-PLC X domain-containing protein 3-like [Uranotaenia lowii]|uniref:PI-PLC X domain-containing protein 3-like n=1 Tax=Uranotaenia lowii TaxID=190385 RepID=UPI0024789CC4|nr:PI-PLC X domain-containing protein 3-like [Uranotaenia lowii]
MNLGLCFLFTLLVLMSISQNGLSYRMAASDEPVRDDVEFTVQAATPHWITVHWKNFRQPAAYIVLAQHFPIDSFTKTESWFYGTRWYYDFGGVKWEAYHSIKPKSESGQLKTVFFDSKTMDKVSVSTKCLDYHAYLVDESGKTLSVFCMKVYPTWMNDLKEHLARFRIRELFIPGTHDSASYKLGPANPNSLPQKYGITQNDNIRQQLLRGIRYIDLRVGYHPSKNWHELVTDLNHIREYALETKEIIIVDMHNIENGEDHAEVHDKLVELFKASLGDVLASPAIGWNGKLQDIWNSGKTVILSYNYGHVVQKYKDLLWPGVKQKWANVQNLKNLYNYLTEVHQQMPNHNSNQPIADMAQFTPSVLGVVTGNDPGLRTSADLVNPNINQWYFNEFGPTANIVAVDFLRGTNIVDAAIYWNLQKAPRS